MSDIKPWEVKSEKNPWKSEAEFITWVRGVLRKGWAVHPLKLIYKESKKIKVENTNPRSKKAHPLVFKIECEKCKKLVSQGDIEIDHKGDFQGKFTCMEEIEGYAKHLFLIDMESVQCVCKPCHKIISHSQKLGVSFEEAALLKEVIRIFKEETKDDIMQFILDFSFIKEYTVGNEKERKKVVEDIFRFAEEE